MGGPEWICWKPLRRLFPGAFREIDEMRVQACGGIARCSGSTAIPVLTNRWLPAGAFILGLRASPDHAGHGGDPQGTGHRPLAAQAANPSPEAGNS